MGNESCKLFVTFLYANIIKSNNNVELRKDFNIINSIEGLFN